MRSSLVRLLVPLLAHVLAACIDDSVVEIGAIEHYGHPALIQAPDTVQSGQSLLVQLMTYGDGCVAFEETDIRATEDGVEITPHDRRRSGACTQILKQIPHDAHVRFDTLGSKVIRVNGRRVDTNLDELVQKSLSITVE